MNEDKDLCLFISDVITGVLFIMHYQLHKQTNLWFSDVDEVVNIGSNPMFNSNLYIKSYKDPKIIERFQNYLSSVDIKPNKKLTGKYLINLSDGTIIGSIEKSAATRGRFRSLKFSGIQFI